jgi:putative Holliday junction resolvase
VLAFDYGTRRIGVAVSDPMRITAGPLEVIDATRAEAEVRRLTEEYAPEVIVVGLPIGLSGREGPAAEAARGFARMVHEVSGVDVELVDERFSTHTAERAMLEGGVKRRNRRARVDKVAAAVILQQYLERR